MPSAVVRTITPIQAGYKVVGRDQDGRRIWQKPDGQLYVFPPRQPERVAEYRELAEGEILRLP